MKKQEEKSLDKLFEGLNELQHEQPSAAFLEDLELRLDALQQKRRKPLFAWWVWSVLGAVVIVSGLIASSKKSSFSASNASNRKSSQYQTSIKSSALKQTSAQASIKSSTSSSKLTSSTVTPLQDQSFISSSAISSSSSSSSSSSKSSSSSSSSSSSFSSLSSSTLIKYRDGSSTQVLSEVQINNDLTASNSSLTSDAEKSKENHQPTENTKPAETTILDATPSEVSSDPKNLKMNKEILLDNLQPKQGQPKHSLGLQFGVSGIFSSFEVPGAIGTLAGYDPHLYRNVRSVSERQTSSWDFNLRYQFFFGRFGIQTGLNYLEWGEQYKYDVISVDGTNRYQYVQVPLCLAYQIPLKKVVFQPSLGFAIGYGLKTEGAYIQPALNEVELVNSSTWSKNSQLQLEFIYSLSNNLTVSIAPVYRRTFGNLIDNGVIMNRYQSVGLLTGFSFRF